MNPFKFYRLDFCIRDLGISVIAILSLGYMPNLFYASLALFQLLLVQMNSFSMNNYFDYKLGGEKNYMGRLLESKNGLSERTVLVLTSLPLIALGITFLYSNTYSLILVAYIVLFFLYQSPLRLKNHWLLSIILNSVCLGLILYIYPYLFLAGKLTLTALIFSIIFFFYMAFHEVVHQIAHINKDHIFSLPEAVGLNKSVRVAEAFLVIPILAALFALAIGPLKYVFFSGTVIFSSLRLYRLSNSQVSVESFNKIRNRWDKFYSFHEGIYYLMFLFLIPQLLA